MNSQPVEKRGLHPRTPHSKPHGHPLEPLGERTDPSGSPPSPARAPTTSAACTSGNGTCAYQRARTTVTTAAPAVVAAAGQAHHDRGTPQPALGRTTHQAPGTGYRTTCVFWQAVSSQRPSSPFVITYSGAPSLSGSAPSAERYTCRTFTAATSGRRNWMCTTS